MARPPIDAKFELLFRKQLNAALDYVESLGGGGGVTDGDKGDITVSGGGVTWTIDNGAVTLSKIGNLAASTILGNNTGSPAAPIAMTVAQTKTLLAIVAADISNLATTVQAYTLDLFADPVAVMNFNQQQTQNFVIENRTSDPGSPVSGQIWLRTDL